MVGSFSHVVGRVSSFLFQFCLSCLVSGPSCGIVGSSVLYVWFFCSSIAPIVWWMTGFVSGAVPFLLRWWLPAIESSEVIELYDVFRFSDWVVWVWMRSWVYLIDAIQNLGVCVERCWIRKTSNTVVGCGFRWLWSCSRLTPELKWSVCSDNDF